MNGIIKLKSPYLVIIYKMELPDDIISIIKDFSRPITRSDWRVIHHMGGHKFHTAIARTFNGKSIPVINRFVDTYDQVNYIYLMHQGYIANIIDANWAKYATF